MTDRNQNRRSRGVGRGSGFRQHFAERMGPTASPTKILKPKSGTLEVLIRARDESEEPSIQICEPYETGKADLHTPYTLQNLKNTFQKPLELNFGDEMYSSSVIGWTEERGHIILINKTFLGITSEEIVPLTDTIFPVLVMGRYEMPVVDESFYRDFVEYEPGFYLILRNRLQMKSYTVGIEVQKGSTPSEIKVQTHRAVLDLHTFHVLWNQTEQKYNKLYKNMGSLHRILDKDNTTYGIYGMYGGGPLPPDSLTAGRFRVTWDQPRSIGSEDFGLNSMVAAFRYDVNYIIHSQRIGFYCSRDGLLAVVEQRNISNPDPNKEGIPYRSLLKEYTFVIIDGVSNYGMFHCEGNTQWVSFKNLIDQPLGPVIVIVPEGISQMRILENKDNPYHRNCSYKNENQTLPPMTINWQVFQNDFNRTGVAQTYEGALQLKARPSATAPEQEPEYIQQMMNLGDFIDYVVFPITSIGRVYLFCLREESKHYPNKKLLSEVWHIYGQLNDQTVEDMAVQYYYLGSASFSYTHKRFPDRQIRIIYSQMFFLRPLFPSEISINYEVTQQDKQTARQMAAEFRQIRKNQEFKQIVKDLIKVDSNQLNNPSTVGLSRQQTIDSILNGLFD